MMEVDSDDSTPSALFVKRSRKRAVATTTNANSNRRLGTDDKKDNSKLTDLEEEKDPDQNDSEDVGGILFRSRTTTRPKSMMAATTSTTSTISLSSSSSTASSSFKKKKATAKVRQPFNIGTTLGVVGEDPVHGKDIQNEKEEEEFEIRRSKLAQDRRKQRLAAVGVSSTATTTTTPLPSISIREEVQETRPRYTSEYLAELKQSTPQIRTLAATMDDSAGSHPISGSSLLEDDDGIPSEAMIRAAKEKRARLRKQQQYPNREEEEQDYISLGNGGKKQTVRSVDMEKDSGPHPHSRLQREEDEYGDGEEEFAEYTQATERIPIGRSAEVEYQTAKRREMQVMVEENETMEQDEDEVEWEQAQLRRVGVDGVAEGKDRSTKGQREPSPYRSAPIPTVSVLPSSSTVSDRLTARLSQLEDNAKQLEAAIEGVERNLESLKTDEEENKSEVETIERKESWFRELEQFIDSLAGMMDDKAPRLDEIEKDAIEVMAKRTSLVQSTIARIMKDELSLFYGVARVQVIPTVDEEEGGGGGEEGVEGNGREKCWLPVSDGGYNSELRQKRRKEREGSDKGQMKPADQKAFMVARNELASRLDESFADVLAPEYLDPAATLLPQERQNNDPRVEEREGSLHPSCIVQRWKDWRIKYPDEYTQMWGGLAVAQIWEFYACKQMALWDPLHDHMDLDKLPWQAELFSYVESGLDNDMALNDGGGGGGGDDEAVSTVLSNVVIPKLISLVEAHAYDPWNPLETANAVKLVDQISYVVDKSSARFQTMISTFLQPFDKQINRLVEIFSSIPEIPPPSFHPDTPLAQVSFLVRLIDSLLSNLLSWNSLVSNKLVVQRNRYIDLIDLFLSQVIWSLVSKSGRIDPVPFLVEKMIKMIPTSLWNSETRSRFNAYLLS